jgi:hypothetical protein
MQVKTKHGRMNALRAFLVEYKWLHVMIGVAGSVLFVVGSTMFIWEASSPTRSPASSPGAQAC